MLHSEGNDNKVVMSIDVLYPDYMWNTNVLVLILILILNINLCFCNEIIYVSGD